MGSGCLTKNWLILTPQRGLNYVPWLNLITVNREIWAYNIVIDYLLSAGIQPDNEGKLYTTDIWAMSTIQGTFPKDLRLSYLPINTETL